MSKKNMTMLKVMDMNMPLSTLEKPKKSDFELWFSGFINQLRADKLMLETEVAPDNISELYETLMSGDDIKIHDYSREKSSKFFIRALIESFYSQLKKRDIGLSKLAFFYTDAKILAWLEINDDDQKSESGIILSEAKVNSMFHQYGFNLDTTIVEKRDELKIPGQYHTIIE